MLDLALPTARGKEVVGCLALSHRLLYTLLLYWRHGRSRGGATERDSRFGLVPHSRHRPHHAADELLLLLLLGAQLGVDLE